MIVKLNTNANTGMIKGWGLGPGNIIGADVVEKRGGRVVVIPFISGRSTTALVEHIRRLKKG